VQLLQALPSNIARERKQSKIGQRHLKWQQETNLTLMPEARHGPVWAGPSAATEASGEKDEGR